ncbi:MAG: hypothetical protein ACYC9L_12135 [Sulfuricaulis sp.]
MKPGYEALVFAARHWELISWLEEHWVKDGKGFPNEKAAESVREASEAAGLDRETVERLKKLCSGEYSTQLWKIVHETQAHDALKLINLAEEKLWEIMKQTGCQCGKAKRKTSRSNWFESEFKILPKHKRDNAAYPSLTAGVEIDFAPVAEGCEVRLLTWFWLRSISGVKHARADKSLKAVVRTHRDLNKVVETEWPHFLVLGSASILAHSSEFGFDPDTTIQDCLEPMRKVTSDHLGKLYEYARQSKRI